jgi:3-oxoacyl-[acyl-carrier protein] reductase
MINNAGYSEMVHIKDQSYASVQQMIAVNFTAAALVTAYCMRQWCRTVEVPSVLPGPPRSLIYISSVAGLRLLLPAQALYVATKQAMIGLSLATLQDAILYGIKVGCICPGLVNTDLGEQFRDDYFGALSELPAQHFLQTQDVARACLYIINSARTVIPYLLVLEPQFHTRKDFHAASIHGHQSLNFPAARATGARSVALITGASKGIGRSIAVWLSQRHYDVILLARSQTGLEDTARLCDPRARCYLAAVDVQDTPTLEQAIRTAAEGFAQGRLDLVISNAGINKRNSAIRGKEVYEDVIRTNLVAASVLTRTALYYMPKSLDMDRPVDPAVGRPALIYIGSNLAREITMGSTGQGPYIASKMGLLGLANSVFHDVRDFGIKVVSILPALVATELGEKTPPASLEMARVASSDLISEADIIGSLAYCLDQCSPECCPTHIYLQNNFFQYNAMKHIAERFARAGSTPAAPQ